MSSSRPSCPGSVPNCRSVRLLPGSRTGDDPGRWDLCDRARSANVDVWLAHVDLIRVSSERALIATVKCSHVSAWLTACWIVRRSIRSSWPTEPHVIKSVTAIRLLSDEPPEQPKRRGRWWMRPSHYGTEYWTAFVNAANTTISQGTPVMSASCLMRSMLASPSGDTELATRLGLKTEWFESSADN